MALLIVPAAAMIAAGEFTPVSKVIAMQSIPLRPALFGRAYSDPTAYYKLRSVLDRRPELLVLGTSRVLAIRSIFFKREVKFFNAGNGVTRLRHFRKFLRHIQSGTEPEVIVLGLDQFLFNDHFDPLAEDDIESQWSTESSISDLFVANWKSVYQDLFSGKFAATHLWSESSHHRIGLNAIVHNNGFRNDGSYTWAQFVADPWNPANDDFEFKNTFDRIAKGHRRFEYGERVSKHAIDELDAFLRECRERGIHVISFLPPYAHAVYEKMSRMPVEYGYLRDLAVNLHPVFSRNGFELSDFSDLAWLGASDRETIDGFHGSEKAYLRITMRLIEKDGRLAKFARDHQELSGRLDAAEGDHVVFPLLDK